MSTVQLATLQAPSLSSMAEVKCDQKAMMAKEHCMRQMACGSGGEGYGNNMWYGIGGFVLWFIIIGIVTWLVIYSLKPSWVINQSTGQVDTAKVLLASIIIALIIVIICWLIKASISSCGRY